MTEQQIRERIRSFTHFAPPARLRIVTDTSEFMSIQAGDVLELNGRFFLIRGEEMEGRFGLDGEPKFWVKRAIDLESGQAKVIKLVFHESFLMRLGEQHIRCFRSPTKESRILEKVRHHPHFMQGFTSPDEVGNPVRIIDKLQGVRFYDYIHELDMDHEHYFHELFPSVFLNIVGCISAINDLHNMGDVHGDIRNDHIIIERSTKIFKWIDFDYTYEWAENPYGIDLYGLGNIIMFAVGKGFHNVPELLKKGGYWKDIHSGLQTSDISLFFSHRIINLRKLFPYIPQDLNEILMHFSRETELFYERTSELLEDLKTCGYSYDGQEAMKSVF
ncbi:MAG TPA: serine/threonine protein kinase [Syntrophobacteraceae bacterium]|nr:serine/threonine protein kinase [Syntrophobacteraceae bacterium]